MNINQGDNTPIVQGDDKKLILLGSGLCSRYSYWKDCTERLLRQCIVGGFRFLYGTLQEHFAAMSLEDYRQGMKP